ncbi:MAG: CoA pyrophosphatase [Desulfobacteraceae bacterium]|nr:CoA pyrophosphatase [Desulfobacteraceae bacterium]
MLEDRDAFLEYLNNSLNQEDPSGELSAARAAGSADLSSVLFLLGVLPGANGRAPEPCLILNKRSKQIRQPGDLCCPGGGISEPVDSLLATLLKLPFSPLAKWRKWRHLRSGHPNLSHIFAKLVATGLREGFEEMRLNPLGVDIMGILPLQELIMFHRTIFPVIGWIRHQTRFFPNREVERIIIIPLRELIQNGNYARYRLEFKINHHYRADGDEEDFPCFVHNSRAGMELLWGATYRITIDFLRLIFDYSPPEMTTLPVFNGTIRQPYLTGQGDRV